MRNILMHQQLIVIMQDPCYVMTIVGPVDEWKKRQKRVIRLLKEYRGWKIVKKTSKIHEAVRRLEDVTIIRKRYQCKGPAEARRRGKQPACLRPPMVFLWYLLLDSSREKRERIIHSSRVVYCFDAITGHRARACWYARQLVFCLEMMLKMEKEGKVLLRDRR